ncbi:hypothetical protein DFR65_10911 [Oceanihabitans sediminis]|uniref:DUF2069 domain-containing protein n=1 Tax=Oceanihabitans sediminis TaxID=1812012 RepID=A0A368P0Y3_9FLAO|nr:hypothetical protein DFR65_10911 [Oceanihabitans sediminis]RCU56482.1 hypothetical protein DU428_12965 [Oceanihabitans sediminis]
MSLISKFAKFIPYLYYISIIAFWFTELNKNQGLTAYAVLLFGIPFLWQIIKPSNQLNFSLGITFVCLSSYMIIAFIFDTLQLISISNSIKNLSSFSSTVLIANFLMALWIMRNSMKKRF